jgi:CRP-like cAMP-binding protein
MKDLSPHYTSNFGNYNFNTPYYRNYGFTKREIDADLGSAFETVNTIYNERISNVKKYTLNTLY